MIRTFELTLDGPLASAVEQSIRRQFEGVRAEDRQVTVLRVSDLDQSALRAVLSLLWDTGHDVIGVLPSSSDS